MVRLVATIIAVVLVATLVVVHHVEVAVAAVPHKIKAYTSCIGFFNLKGNNMQSDKIIVDYSGDIKEVLLEVIERCVKIKEYLGNNEVVGFNVRGSFIEVTYDKLTKDYIKEVLTIFDNRVSSRDTNKEDNIMDILEKSKRGIKNPIYPDPFKAPSPYDRNLNPPYIMYCDNKTSNNINC